MFPWLLVALIPCVGSNPPERVQGVVGGVAILPCLFKLPPNKQSLTLVWEKVGPEPETALVIRDNGVLYKEKEPVYWFRTLHFGEDWRNGNGSMMLLRLRLEDAGTFSCSYLWDDVLVAKVEVELLVGPTPPEATPPATTPPEATPPEATHTPMTVVVTVLALGFSISILCNLKQAGIIQCNRPASHHPQQESGAPMPVEDKSSVRPALSQHDNDWVDDPAEGRRHAEPRPQLHADLDAVSAPSRDPLPPDDQNQLLLVTKPVCEVGPAAGSSSETETHTLTHTHTDGLVQMEANTSLV